MNYISNRIDNVDNIYNLEITAKNKQKQKAASIKKCSPV